MCPGGSNGLYPLNYLKADLAYTPIAGLPHYGLYLLLKPKIRHTIGEFLGMRAGPGVIKMSVDGIQRQTA